MLARQILIALVVILAALVLLRVAVDAQHVKVPHEPNLSDQWSDANQTLLAAAVLGEAGWDDKPPDHDAIPWVVYRRWVARGGAFENTVRTYCKALNGKRPWLLELDADGNEPASWPKQAGAWSNFESRWLAIRARIGAWERGQVPDPCNAWHFGGGMDTSQGRMQAIACPGARNIFYRLGPRKVE